MLSINLIFHPPSLTVASPALSSAALIDVVGDKAALPVHARHVLIISTLRVMARATGVLCHDDPGHASVQSRVRQFGNVTEGIRSLYGARWYSRRLVLLQSAGVVSPFCFPPFSMLSVADEPSNCNQQQQQSRNSCIKDVGKREGAI